MIKWLLELWRGKDDRGNLTQDEYEEYEFLGESMEWRRLMRDEQERYDYLNNKRTAK